MNIRAADATARPAPDPKLLNLSSCRQRGKAAERFTYGEALLEKSVEQVRDVRRLAQLHGIADTPPVPI